ncbi:alpha-L-fucosidase [Ilumatobacter fluminis]|uniref:alpha-L-fucosidase n=2 Tax=Ilumatobacter fluminis TaxID=467091 RepID=A0A4R7HZN9_9ACTN|nr:alpha-L-fucosidase [Ilumatobacter fluminis]
MLVDVSLATVPGWAPVGQDVSWYRAHIDGRVADANLHPTSLVEALHYHRERWGHVDDYDDFFPFLHFDDFDPDAWAGLARDAGMGYAVMTAKHHDGLCWWDAPGTDRTVMHDGPARNVLGQFSAACERAEVVFGVSYSLLDWSDGRYPGTDYVDDVVHPQVIDLVERMGAQLVWADGHWGAGGDRWRSDELHEALRRIRPEVLVDDHWWASRADVRVVEHRLPGGIETDPWEYRRALGASGAFNRAEPDDALASPTALVSELTEVVAKGGHMLLRVGPDAGGAFADAVVERLRAVGGWVRRHQRLIDEGRPWAHWGDADARYLTVDDELYAIDVSGQGRFAHLGNENGRVVSISTADGNPVEFDQTDGGVRLTRPPRRSQRMPAVYLVEHDAPPPPPIELFPAGAEQHTELAELLTDAKPGDIVQLGEGIYVGPARIPDGVTVRGLGPDRTTVDGAESVAVTLGTGSRFEHCRTRGGGRRVGHLPRFSVRVAGDGATIIGCDVVGHVALDGGSPRIISSTASGVVAAGPNRIEIVRSTFGGIGTDVGIAITGGAGHLIDSCEFEGHRAAIVLTGTIGSTIRANRIRARWWGISAVDCEATDIIGNAIESTMRAVDIDGGTEARVTSNAVSDGDSGCVLQDGASNAEIGGNHWARCRVGLLAWGAGEFRQRDNMCADLTSEGHDVVVGP